MCAAPCVSNTSANFESEKSRADERCELRCITTLKAAKQPNARGKRTGPRGCART
jgi:hypothetical protein